MEKCGSRWFITQSNSSQHQNAFWISKLQTNRITKESTSVAFES